MLRPILRLTIGFILLTLLLSIRNGDNQNLYSLPREAVSVYPCDLRLNGSVDLVIGHKTNWQDTITPTITFLLNENNGLFKITDTSKNFCGYQMNIFAVDLNDDFYPDVVTLSVDFSSGQASRSLRVYFSNEGVFQNFTEYNLNTSSTISFISRGDINGDGKTDIVVASETGHFWGVMYNLGNENFSSPKYFSLANNMPWKIVCGDLNNDGRDDIVLCGQQTEVFFSYPNTFKHLLLSTDFASDCWISDLDNDGNNDIVTNSDGAWWMSIVNIYKNCGNDSLTLQSESVYNVSYTKIFIADFNNDSLKDILLLKGNNTGYDLYYNVGNFQFTDSINIVVSLMENEWMRNCYCADLDNNGYIDIVTLRTTFARISNLEICFNDGNGHFVDHPLGINTPIIISNPYSFMNYPNPFYDYTTIKFNLMIASSVKLSLHNSRGDLVAKLIEQKMNPGIHLIKWDHKSFYGNKYPPGIYIGILQIDEINFQSIKIIAY